MTVLIDPPRWPAHGILWSHLVSDSSLDELHAFARKLELPRRAFDLDHYDVPAFRYDEIVALGATPVEGKVLIRRLVASGLRVRARDRLTAKNIELQASWDWLLPGTSAIGQELLVRWNEPHRVYHGPFHLDHVLNTLDLLDPARALPRTIPIAAWFHDAVHDGHSPDDEDRSAELAHTLLLPVTTQATAETTTVPAPPRAGHDVPLSPPTTDETAMAGRRVLDDAPLSLSEVDEVARLVAVTIRHDPAPDDQWGQVLSDADLAVLGSPPRSYHTYTRQIRAEYPNVPEDRFRSGRAAVLTALLDRPRIFATAAGHERWEKRARVNLVDEIATLQNG